MMASKGPLLSFGSDDRIYSLKIGFVIVVNLADWLSLKIEIAGPWNLSIFLTVSMGKWSILEQH